MIFEPIEWHHQARYTELWRACSQSSSDYSFAVLLGWAPRFGYQIAFDNDLCWVHSTKCNTCLGPVGDWENQDWTAVLARRGTRGSLSLVPEELALEIVDQLGEHCRIGELRNSHQYMYQRAVVADLGGKRNRRLRSKINHFEREYTGEYRSFSQDLIAPIRDFQGNWLESQRGMEGFDMLVDEQRVINLLLDHPKEFNLHGGALFVDDNMVGYTLAELAPDNSIQIHVEKANYDYQGSYQALYHAFVCTLPETVEYVNREEDMGDPGLRQAKLSYSPFCFLRQYRLHWDLDCPIGKRTGTSCHES